MYVIYKYITILKICYVYVMNNIHTFIYKYMLFYQLETALCESDLNYI